MLHRPLADLTAGDQEKPIHAGKRARQCFWLGIVGDADFHALVADRDRRLLGGIAHARDDAAGGHRLKQRANHEAAKLACGAGDEELRHIARIIHRTARNRPRPPNTWARNFIAKNFIKQPIRIVMSDINGLALIAHFS